MTKIFVFASVVFLSAITFVRAEEPAKAKSEKPTSATYLITGLHCPPCTRSVESSLSKVQGIRSIKVDWKTKNAKVEFDESAIPAQRVAQLIAATPHMMGGNMSYDGWLALKVPELKDDAVATKAKDALRGIAGVKSVATYPAQKAVGIQFAADGKTTSKELIDALNKAGIKAEM